MLVVRHATHYTYANPVTLGEHRLMVRPRDSHDLRLVETQLSISPRAKVEWIHDVFGNSVACLVFKEKTQNLKIESILKLERFARGSLTYRIDPEAVSYPFLYSAQDRTDLGRLVEMHYPDPKGVVEQWAKTFARERPGKTLDILSQMNAAIKANFTYSARHAEGTQTPVETLQYGSGTCRDFALLFIEAVRSLGFAARFVTGYLYDPALDGGDDHLVQGAGSTHAWADVYLPGAGWSEYDPTNGFVEAKSLIRVAVTRDPSQAIPVMGSFTGGTNDFLGMTVNISVTEE